MRYDVAIIGTGPAGLSAAITLKIRNKNIILFGNKNLSDKIGKAHEIQNYLGLPNISGEDLSKNFSRHIDKMGIEITEESISNVYAMGDYYTLQTKSNTMYEASSVILATGVNFGKPYPGEEEFLGRGVSYCATCDAPLYRGKRVAIVGSTQKEEAEANFMSEIAEKVYYIPLYKAQMQLNDTIEVINKKPVSIAGGLKADKLILKDERESEIAQADVQEELAVDGIFILRDSISPKALVPGLIMDGNHIAVDRSMKTNLAGCFACGDIVGMPYQYIKSAGEGNVAALSAVQYLNE